MRRRAALGLLAGFGAVTLSGCFRPMLAKTETGRGLYGKVALPPVRDRFSNAMNETLESRLGPPADTAYRLEVEMRVTERGLLVAQDNAVTRIQLTGRAQFRLFRDGEPEPVLDDSVFTEAGFDETASLYASRTTRRDIEERIARDLGERIARRVLARGQALEASG